METIKIRVKLFVKSTLQKKCWNFKAVFWRNSAGIPEVNIWNHNGILTEFHWNSIGILPPILSKFTQIYANLRNPHVFQNYSDKIPLIFQRNKPEFLWNFCGNLMGFLWHFLESGWYFD